MNLLSGNLRPSEADMIFRDNRPNRNNSKKERGSDLEIASGHFELHILEYIRPSEAKIEGCSMRKRAWLLY